MADSQWYNDVGQETEYEAHPGYWETERNPSRNIEEEWTIIRPDFHASTPTTDSYGCGSRELSPSGRWSPFIPIEETGHFLSDWAQPRQTSKIDTSQGFGSHLTEREDSYEKCLTSFLNTNEFQHSSTLPEYPSKVATNLSCYSCQGAFQSHLSHLFIGDEYTPELQSCCISRAALHLKKEETFEGTCRWFLNCEQFRRWQAQPSGLFWLSGVAGTGKSVLTSYITHELEASRKPGDIVAFYFADGYYKRTGTALGILRSVLEQVISHDPTEKKHLKLWSQYEQIADTGIRTTNSTVTYFLSKIKHTLRGQQTLYIVLDGLDDLHERPEERELVLELIDYASRHDPKHRIKCFLSSNAGFLPPRTWQTLCRVDLDTHPYTRDDMVQYVHGRLQNQAMPSRSRDLENFSKVVLESASHSFLLLRLFIEFGLCQVSSVSNLTNGSKAIFNQVLPGNLPTMYGYMLGRIQDSNIKAALSMLKWVTHVVRPLDSSELLNALYIQTSIELKEEDIGKISAGLLSNIGSQIRFAHLSVRNFLQSELSGHWNDISCEADEMIARECLRLLRPMELLESLHLIDPTNSEFKALVHSQSLLPYARTHWIFHYKRAEKRSSFLAGLLHEQLERGILMDGRKADSGFLAGESKAVKTPEDINSLLNRSKSIHFRSLNLVNTALRVACQFGFWTLAKLELEMGANPNAISGPKQRSPLHWAARAGNLDIVQMLLQYRADPGVLSGSGKSAIVYAMLNSHLDIVEFLQAHATTNQPPDPWFPTSITAGHATQELSLKTFLSQSCAVCDELQVEYELSAVLPLNNNNDEESYVPILVSGELLPRSDINVPFSDILSRPIASTTVMWYPGARMFHVLSVASRRGIEDVRRLLIAVGNDDAVLDTNISICHLVAKLSV